MSVGDAQQIPMQLSRGCVVASLQIDLSEDVIARFRKDLLEFLHSTGAHSVILDVSGLDVIDGNVETRDVNAALDLDDAFDAIERLRAEAERSDSAESRGGDA